MKTLLLLLALVLMVCSYRVETYRSDNRLSHVTLTTKKHLGNLHYRINRNDKNAKKIETMQRDLRAIKHEIMGVETGCRFGQVMMFDDDGEFVRDELKTICKDDVKTVSDNE